VASTSSASGERLVRVCPVAQLVHPSALERTSERPCEAGTAGRAARSAAKALRLVARSVAPAASTKHLTAAQNLTYRIDIAEDTRTDTKSNSASVEKVGSRSLKKFRLDHHAVFDPQIDCGRGEV
jgi:hypothetical protein